MLLQHSFGTWLRRRRKALDLTREEFAARVGYSAATIRKLEAEERHPSEQVVERLAEFFNIPHNQRTAFLRFARGDLRSAPGEPNDDAPWQLPGEAIRSNLPSPTACLIGREREMLDICRYLTDADIRLVTLTGPPGIGKTRLSVEAAHAVLPNFPDGVFFVALATLEDPSLIAPAVLQTLGYVETRGLQAVNQLRAGIGDKRMLLVLDNCEHLIEAVAPFAADLLSGCTRLNILVTSREALRVPGEWTYSLSRLGTPQEGSGLDKEAISQYPAVILFSERARAVRSDFALTADNVQSVAAICGLLDGLPLAIELLAARMRVMSPQALLERLTDQYILSADGMRAVSARQKTLYNAINWSYSTLSAEEQMVFTQSAVFSGGFTLEAAEAIFPSVHPTKPISDLIISLVDKSLLQRELPADGEPRFLMLATIKQFALLRLRLMGEEVVAHDKHLAYFLDFAEKGAVEMRGPQQVVWGNRLEAEQDNFRAALEWSTSNAKTESALRLLCALGWAWEVHGHYLEAHCWLDRILSLPDVNDYPLILSRLLNHIGRHSWSQGNIDDARLLLEESQSISQGLGTDGELNLAETLNWLGLVILYGDRDPHRAKSMFKAGLKRYQKWGDQRGVALSTFHLGIVESEQKNYAAAVTLLEQGMSLFRQLGDLFFIARVSTFLGSVYQKQGSYEKAQFFFEQCLKLDIEVQFLNGIIEGWFELGNLHLAQGAYDRAGCCFEESVSVCSTHNFFKVEPYYLSGLLALRLDNYALAFERFSQLLKMELMPGERVNTGVILSGMAAVAGGTGQPERAARLSGAAQAAFTSADKTRPISDGIEFNRHIQLAFEHLGEAVFEALQKEGSAMHLEQAVSYALEEGVPAAGDALKKL